MENDCRKDYAGNVYYLLVPFFIDSTIEPIISLIIMFVLLNYQYFKVMNIPRFKIERTKLYLMGSFFMINLVMRICISKRLILPNNMENTLKILFILSAFSSIIRTMVRFLKLVYYSGIIIFLLLSTIFWFAIYFRVRFQNVQMRYSDDELHYLFSF